MVRVVDNSPRKAGAYSTDQPFPEAAAAVMRDMQNAFAGLIASIPYEHHGIRKAADLHKALQLDRKLTWQFYKVATADNPLTVGQSVPKKVSLARLFQAAVDRKVPGHVVDQASQAFDRFEHFVAGHAGDRDIFGSMMSSVDGTSADRLYLSHKKAAFKAWSHFLGLQSKTTLHCNIMHPAAQPHKFDTAWIRGIIGVKHLRPDIPLLLSSARLDTTEGTPAGGERKSLDPRGFTPHGVALMHDFCTQPLPEFRRRTNTRGTAEVEILGEGVGRASLATYFTGELQECGFDGWRKDDDPIHACAAQIRTPSEVLIFDFLVYENVFGPNKPRLSVGTDHRESDLHLLYRPHDELPVRESHRYLGRGPDCLHTPDVPRYPEIFRAAMKQAGWDANRFDVYRCRIEYPIMPSSVMMAVDLPDEPAF